MPGFDGTGPMGSGPMTGGGRGFCAVPLSGGRPSGLRQDGYIGRGGRGFFGRGGGRGWRNCYYATGLPGWARAGYFNFPDLTPENEIDALKKQSDFLKARMEEIQNRISTLEKSASDGK